MTYMMPIQEGQKLEKEVRKGAVIINPKKKIEEAFKIIEVSRIPNSYKYWFFRPYYLFNGQRYKIKFIDMNMPIASIGDPDSFEFKRRIIKGPWIKGFEMYLKNHRGEIRMGGENLSHYLRYKRIINFSLNGRWFIYIL